MLRVISIVAKKMQTSSLILAPFLFAPALSACTCVSSLSICDEVRLSDAVFIGTVQSIVDPKTLLGAPHTQGELQALLEKYLFQESQVTLKIKTVFRQESDDDSQGDADNDKDGDKDRDGDKNKDKDDDKNSEKKFKKGDTVVVWTESGECGYEFHVGETYLVYAGEDEGNGRLETTRCTRTARVTDAGEDLAYLYFYQNGGTESARLEGFATSELRRVNRDRFHYSAEIESPVSGITVELRSDRSARFAKPNLSGRFFFDGLAEGIYRLFAYGGNYPADRTPLTSSVPLRVKARSCNSTVLFIPGTSQKH